MSLQPSARDADAGVNSAPVQPSAMRRHQVAYTKLNRAVEEQRQVVLMIGVDSFELSQVIGEFDRDLDERTTSVRLRQPQANALAAFGEINRAIGFDPKELTLSDLQNVLTLFLEYQCNHGHRTVLFVEKADEQSMWLLDCMARLVESTESTRTGRNLLVVLSGSNRLTEVLQNPAFAVIRRKAESPIRLAPFSIFESREFLRRMSSSAGLGDIQDTFEFDAIERLHRISGGIPHVLAKLFRECVAIVNENDNRSATPKVVVMAARNLRAEDSISSGRSATKPTLVHQSAEPTRRLLIRCPEQEPRELSLKVGRFMVGRSSTTDIQLPNSSVSRRHALLIDSGDAIQVLDLGSSNGTYVGAERISEATLGPGTVLTLGDCEIEYAVD